MKQLFRATAVAIGVGIGIVSFGGVAHAWDESANAQSACVGGVASITVTFTNVEPATGALAMVVSASDNQSDETAIWGNGESEVTVTGGETVTGTINTHMASVSEGSVEITERWANGSAEQDVVVVTYESRDCTPVAPQLVTSATTQGAGGCDTTTGRSFVNWSVTNTGEIGLRAVGTDLPGGTPDTVIGPGATLDMPTFHAAGNYSVAGYSVDVETTDGRTSTLHGNLAPALTGACTLVGPQTQPPVGQPTVLAAETTPTAPAASAPRTQVAAATLPRTGSPAVPLTVAGFGVLGLGLLASGATNTRAARLRRFAVALTRVRADR
jgi:hypothetical protein